MKRMPLLHVVLLLAAAGAWRPAPAADSVLAECRRIADKLASVDLRDCVDRDLQLSAGRTVRGAPILYKEYGPRDDRKPRGRVLLMGGIHGDEYSSVSIVFKWMKSLDEHHSGLFHWVIVPLLNPDGLLQPESQRMNANGVDLNRNFPMEDWERLAIGHWVNETDRNPRRYPGQAPLSEPETRWFVDEIDRFAPDVIVSVHAPHGVVDYDGPEDGPYKLGRLYLSLLGTFPGSLGNWAGMQRKIPVVTIELPYAGKMLKADEVGEIWRDLVRWLGGNLAPRSSVADHSDQDREPS
jgi:hypothetical protein